MVSSSWLFRRCSPAFLPFYAAEFCVASVWCTLLLPRRRVKDAADAASDFSKRATEEELSYRMESVPEDLMSTLYPFQVRFCVNTERLRKFCVGRW